MTHGQAMPAITKGDIMYELYVSYDCGTSYHKERAADSIEEFEPRMKELDKAWLRWYVEKNGDSVPDVQCAIHIGIIEVLHSRAWPDRAGVKGERDG